MYLNGSNDVCELGVTLFENFEALSFISNTKRQTYAIVSSWIAMLRGKGIVFGVKKPSPK